MDAQIIFDLRGFIYLYATSSSACNPIALKAIYNFGWRNIDSWYYSLGYGHLRLDSSTIVVHGIIVSNIPDDCFVITPGDHDVRSGVIIERHINMLG